MAFAWRPWIAALRPACLLPALLGPLPALASVPPNIVFILLDDVGYGDLGAYGGTFVATPNLDRLAAEGVRFTEYHSNGAVCTPARAAILTGEYPIRLGLGDVLQGTSQRGLPPQVETLADRLRAEGYATGHFGKWHLGSRPEHLPTSNGFDHSAIAVKSNGSYVDPWVSIDDGPHIRYRGHRTEFTTDQALGFLEAHADRPFFLNVWYNAAHRPYEPPPEWAARYPGSESGRYAAVLSHADEQIGRILDALSRMGLDSRTLVLVASDNGGIAKDIATNGPLRGHKRELFEGGLRVPLIARWTGTVPAGSVNPSLFLGIDFVPTLMELAGGRAPARLPGQSMSPALLAAEVMTRRRAVFWAGPEGLAPTDGDPGDLYRYAVRVGEWKLVRQLKGGDASPMLFDLATDPGETTNLAPEHPGRVEELELAYRVWRASESRVDTPMVRVSGAASARRAWLRLDGGTIGLAVDPRVAVHDGDLTFLMTITPASVGTEQVIAEHEGSFRLVLTPIGSVRLTVEGADGAVARLESEALLRPGVAAHVAFTLFGWPGSNAELKLFVDGRLEGESRDLSALAISHAELRIGNDATGSQPFRGLLWDPRFHLVSFGLAELADTDLDGVRDPLDVCLATPDGPVRPDGGSNVQRDSDGDGIGNACDPDLNGDGTVTSLDRFALLRALGSRQGEPRYDPDLDFDGDGVVGFADLLVLERSFDAPPGPSGRICTQESPCAVR